MKIKSDLLLFVTSMLLFGCGSRTATSSVDSTTPSQKLLQAQRAYDALPQEDKDRKPARSLYKQSYNDLADSYPRLSLSFGKIPFGKSKNEIGITGEEKKPIFDGKGGEIMTGLYLHPPSSVKAVLKIDRSWGAWGGKGYDNASMTSVSFENFKSKERSFGNVQFFFVGPSKRLAVVSKQISVPYEQATLRATFVGLRKAFTNKVGVQPIEYKDELTSFFDEIVGNSRMRASGQFAIWSLSNEVVIVMSEFPEKEDNLAPIYIIHASKVMLQEYVNLQQKLESETTDKASSVINSAF